MKNKEVENTIEFEFDEKIQDYTYLASGNELIYDFNQIKSGTIVMKVCLDIINEYQYFFEGEDEKGNQLSLYRKSDEYLYIKYNENEISTNLLFTTGIWHTLAFSFNEQIQSNSENSDGKLQIRVLLDDMSFNCEINNVNELSKLIFTIGKKKNNVSKKLKRNNELDYPLYGKIQTIATSEAFNELDTLNSLISSLEGISTTKVYDELGILQEKTVHRNGQKRISNSYNYFLNDNSNVIFSAPKFEFISYKTTDDENDKISIVYEYDNACRLIGQTFAGQIAYDYEYDDNGRLYKLTESSNYFDNTFNDIIEYTYKYDANGNIISKETKSYNIYSSNVITSLDTYSYDNEKLISYNNNPITYESKRPLYISSYNLIYRIVRFFT